MEWNTFKDLNSLNLGKHPVAIFHQFFKFLQVAIPEHIEKFIYAHLQNLLTSKMGPILAILIKCVGTEICLNIQDTEPIRIGVGHSLFKHLNITFQYPIKKNHRSYILTMILTNLSDPHNSPNLNKNKMFHFTGSWLLP